MLCVDSGYEYKYFNTFPNKHSFITATLNSLPCIIYMLGNSSTNIKKNKNIS